GDVSVANALVSLQETTEFMAKTVNVMIDSVKMQMAMSVGRFAFTPLSSRSHGICSCGRCICQDGWFGKLCQHSRKCNMTEEESRSLCESADGILCSGKGCFLHLGSLTVPPVAKALPKANSNTHHAAASLAVKIGLYMVTVMVQDVGKVLSQIPSQRSWLGSQETPCNSLDSIKLRSLPEQCALLREKTRYVPATVESASVHPRNGTFRVISVNAMTETVTNTMVSFAQVTVFVAVETVSAGKDGMEMLVKSGWGENT
ncbi:hypothetical protein EK904_003744, partial [Melospiza melodia maxima]